MTMQNLIQARLYNYTDAWEIWEWDAGGSFELHLFLFTTYVPQAWDVMTMISANPSTAPFVAPIGFYLQQDSPRVELGLAANGIFTPDTTPLEYPINAATGTTLTNGVDVQGFLATTTIEDFGFVNGVDPLEFNILVRVLSDGATVRGGDVPYSLEAGARGYESIIIPETLYTQAMADNRNLFDVTVGPVTAHYQVVGLFVLPT